MASHFDLEPLVIEKEISGMLLLIFILYCTHLGRSIATDILTPRQPLLDGDTLISAGQAFALGFFSPGVSKNRYVGIWYNKVSVQTVVWVANRQSPLPDNTGRLILTEKGSLAIVNSTNSTIILTSFSVTLNDPIMQLLDTGNLVVREADSLDPNKFAWQSFDHPTDSLLPGMKLGWDLRTGLNRNLTAWRSDDDPSPGSYVISMDIRVIPQLIVWSGSDRLWQSGPWDGKKFANIPEMSGFSGFNFTFVNNKDEIYYMYNTESQSIITRLLVNQSGTVNRYVWIQSTKTWNLFWFVPKSPCDKHSPCGPYGLCNLNESPMCSCLQGFEPKSKQQWVLRDDAEGCARATPLDCRNGTDGFMVLSHSTMPDTWNATVDMSIGLEECRARCLANCSCRAYASAAAVYGGGGCIIWVSDLIDLGIFVNGGQDVYVRLAAADLASMLSKPKRKSKAMVAVIVSILSVATLLVVVWIYIISRRRKRMISRASTTSHDQAERNEDENLELPLFQWSTIIAATNNFACENILGEGGFGPVFKGKLGEGQEIAVKKLSRTSTQGVVEFKNEVNLIAKLQHRNLVRLLGYCIQGEERLLVYEHMPNKSLDAFLFDRDKAVYLDWSTRHRIIAGIARGLLYLHQDSRFRIIHRDLKASNILLDSEMNPKISDFGMARIFGGEEATTRTRRIVGTYGYMSPEYAMDGIFSVKSDVFSYGVLVLEIITGRKNKAVFFSETHLYLLGDAWRLWNEGKCLELVDPSIGHSFSASEVMRCINVGLSCVQQHPEDRPTMSSVVLMLGGSDEPLVQPDTPGFAARLVSTSDENEENSFNYMTLSTSVAR